MSETTLQLILQKLGTIETDTSEMKNEIFALKTDVNGLKDDVSGIKSEITGLKDQMNSMQAQLDENTEITKAIHHRQSESDAKLEGLSLDFAKLHGEVIATKDNVAELVEDQKSINEVIGEHEVSIRSLRRKLV